SVWNHADGFGLVMPVFRVLGQRVGFLGFPVAGEALDRIPGPALREASVAIARAAGLTLVRVVRSIGAGADESASALLPEFRIRDLPSWTPAKKLRRDLSYARRRATVAIAMPGAGI